MQSYENILLRVWREVCRHLEIDGSTATIAAVLAECLPIRELVVCRLDLQQARLATVASAARSESAAGQRPEGELTAAQLRVLVDWGRAARVARGCDVRDRAVFDALLGRHAAADLCAVPLAGPDGLAGVLVVRLAQPGVLDADQEALLGALAEPFSAALENDRRLHEMKTLREAAEAERRALLTRLGRKEMTTPIIGAEGGLRPVLERVETVCRSDLPVLLLGETGTGKEVVARAIHDRSARHAGPFIRVNCGALPPELIDSQLFGHERGSFTGAVDTHRGWFERADGGTLLLDEIGELPAAVQVRLLRVLQDGFIERVGGKHALHVDVRIVAATHCDLAAMVREGTFRQDLWYRVAVFPILIPPLRDRREDIPVLACHFAEKAATRFGLRLVMPTPEDIRLLAGYAWPGNVRELGAVIDRAALLGNGRRLEVEQALGGTLAPAGLPVHRAPLAPEARPPERAPVAAAGRPPHGIPAAEAGARSVPPVAAPVSDAPPPAVLSDTTRGVPAPDAVPAAPALDAAGDVQSLDDVLRAHIEAALRACLGRVEGPFGAATRLNVNPNTLRTRMRRLGIDWKRYRSRG